MTHLLDTNILSAHLRRPSGLQHRFVQHAGRLYTSTIALAELYDLIVVTHNTKDVQNIPGLRLEDWLTP